MPDKFVAFFGPSECVVIGDDADAPQGSLIIHSAAELTLYVGHAEMDRIRTRILGPMAKASDSLCEAADLLWATLTSGVEGPDPTFLPRKYERVRTELGNLKCAINSQVEVLQLTWVPGADYMVDHFHARFLQNTGRELLQIFVDDGRCAWTRETVGELLASATVPSSGQSALRLFKYYLQLFVAYRMMRRVSYLEVAAAGDSVPPYIIRGNYFKRESTTVRGVRLYKYWEVLARY